MLSNLFPGICVLCRRRSRRTIDLCPSCERAFTCNDQACHVCGAPLAASGGVRVCGRCVATPPPWMRTLAPYTYAQPLTGVIEGLKSGNGLRQARILGALLSASAKAEYAATELPEALIPVPLTRRRLRQRGFNQAALLARSTARRLGLPSLSGHLVRIRNTPPQRSLPRNARLSNVRTAFAVKRPINYRRVALVDDVSTTGATAHAASTALLAGGAEEVHLWVAAKAV
ncbi:MAG: ComF family protein [Gammaproteobacteria bacterium]|nr:ComF family protein [Gammaproteobacteria bacterium]